MDDTDMPDADDRSDVSSVFEPIFPPIDQLRTYKVVHPPELPEWTNIDGTDYETRWYDDSWRYTARAYSRVDGAGFEVRQMDINSRDDVEVEDPFSSLWWPPKYALGAPSDQKATWTALLGHWGFPVLEKAGFINFYPGDEDVDMKPLGRLAGKRNPSGRKTELIHPILTRGMWKGIDDDEYDLMEPSILLASAILDDPATLAFFHAIADTSSMTQFHDTFHGRCMVASIPPTLTDQQQAEVYNKVIKMRAWTAWHHMPVEKMVKARAYGLTKARKKTNNQDISASQAYTSQSDINIAQSYVSILERYRDDDVNGTHEHAEQLEAWLDKFNVPWNRRPHQLYPESAYDRTVFLLAETLVHEFAHAFAMAYFPIPPSGVWRPAQEPFIHGNRSNELGCALIDHLVGGLAFSMIGYTLCETTEHRQMVNSPFGMYIEGQWDLWTENEKDSVERVRTDTPAGGATSRQTVYPIPAKYFYNMHTEETWEHQVPRFGLASIRMPRLKEWSMTIPKPP